MGWVVCSDAVVESCDAVLIFVVTASRSICDAVSSHCREILDQCWCRIALLLGSVLDCHLSVGDMLWRIRVKPTHSILFILFPIGIVAEEMSTLFTFIRAFGIPNHANSLLRKFTTFLASLVVSSLEECFQPDDMHRIWDTIYGCVHKKLMWPVKPARDSSWVVAMLMMSPGWSAVDNVEEIGCAFVRMIRENDVYGFEMFVNSLSKYCPDSIITYIAHDSNGNDQSGLIMTGACVSSRFNVLNAWMHSLEKLKCLSLGAGSLGVRFVRNLL
ncbi:hypothetical protein Tco_0108789 [Tanacetum coccineum]